MRQRFEYAWAQICPSMTLPSRGIDAHDVAWMPDGTMHCKCGWIWGVIDYKRMHQHWREVGLPVQGPAVRTSGD